MMSLFYSCDSCIGDNATCKVNRTLVILCIALSALSAALLVVVFMLIKPSWIAIQCTAGILLGHWTPNVCFCVRIKRVSERLFRTVSY